MNGGRSPLRSSAPVIVRVAVPADHDGVRKIVDQAYAPYRARIGRHPGPMLDDYRARIAAGALFVAVDSTGGQAAFAGILVLEADTQRADTLLLDNIAVAPDRRGRGIAARLFDFAEAEARRRDKTRIQLYTNALMHENLALYRRSGWREIGPKTEDGYRRIYFDRPVAPR